MVARFNLNVDQSIQMDGTMKVVWYPSREGEWVRYTDYADRIAELEDTIKLVRECPVFTVHKNPGGRIRVVAKDNIDLALKGEATCRLN